MRLTFEHLLGLPAEAALAVTHRARDVKKA